jgi:hypothetical protein
MSNAWGVSPTPSSRNLSGDGTRGGEQLHQLFGDFAVVDEEVHRGELPVEDVEDGGQREAGPLSGQLAVLRDEGFPVELSPRVVGGGHRLLREGVETLPELRERGGMGQASGYVLHELFLAGTVRAGAAAEPDDLLEVFDDVGAQRWPELHASSSWSPSLRAASSAARETSS